MDGPAGWRRWGGRAVRPVLRLWESPHPLDAYALVHLSSSAGDALVAIALADSVFFSLPVGQAKVKVALYLALTMAPLAAAAPLLVPLLDRGAFRRALVFAAAAGRALVAIYAAPRFGTLLLFPAAFVLLVLSKVHGITKNGLTAAYASPEQDLVHANAGLARVAVAGAVLGAVPGVLALKLGGARAVLYLAAVGYAVGALLDLRLPLPDAEPDPDRGRADTRGRVAGLGAAAGGTAGLRGAGGFLLFLLAFTLRGRGRPAWWFGLLAGSAGAGGFVADFLAPRLPSRVREETILVAALVGAGGGALAAFLLFRLPVLVLFAGLAGGAAELGRLAFQSLMQRRAPGGAQGRVFVRYEILFQLAWVAGAFIPSVVPIPFRAGVLVMAVFYLPLAAFYLRASPRRRDRSA